MDNASILVVLTGSLGDLVRGLSVASAIKAHNPAHKVSWVVDSTWASILTGHPSIDELIVFNRGAAVSGTLSLIKQLRERSFDICLDMQRHLKSGLCSFFSGARRRIGFAPNNTREFNYFFNNEYIQVQSDEESKLLHYFAFLDQISIARPEKVDFGLTPLVGECSLLVDYQAGNDKFIGLVLSSSWESKDWPVSGYLELIKTLLTQTSYKLLLLGSSSDSDRASQLTDKINDQRLINLSGKTDLKTLVNVIGNCTLCIGPDSGPGHVASAVGVPYVSLFGPTPPERVAPYKSENLVVRSKVACSPCSRKRCPGLGTVCMKLISPHSVYQKVEEVLTG